PSGWSAIRSRRWFCQKHSASATPNAASAMTMRERSSSRWSTRLSLSSKPIGRMRFATATRRGLLGRVRRVSGARGPRRLFLGLRLRRHRRSGLGARLLELGMGLVLVLAGDRVLELAHSAPERLPEIGQSLRPEDQKHDDEDDDDLEWADVGHVASFRCGTAFHGSGEG